ncbi:DUF350 domain-containing protein [Leptospira wolffii]|uniref:DUF350 domain-containing protein n=1 Tax=Leptospira wolffii TaxID=409998 RepID=A0A2M9ZDM0_9LEPT|nr:DUF350 domain-containing protein [Leptospira wolffii]EPG68231.1 PF03994 domain protein [Leptospira wolffii serovar Khorat str. Khorat-H2]PJZ66427.1 DUF350 domain-containing protein [Leptospira wolffii]TGK60007.1 DUF350 domain-containing protein [Leptospira wolffii]TGK72351.1 DUF350 domain-containing protein [Leptospira wolffii]TGK76014.1 DUF350 domain-containing protein [Leptospira wolffii]
MDFVWKYISVLGKDFAFFGLGFLVFFIGKKVKDWTEPRKLDHELVRSDNGALALSLSGHYLGIIILFITVVSHPGEEGQFLNDLIQVFSFSILGVLLLLISQKINDGLILGGIDAQEEIYEKKNLAVASVLFGGTIASSFFIAAALNGDIGAKVFPGGLNLGVSPILEKTIIGCILSVIFFAVGQIGMILFAYYYKLWIPYRLRNELESKQNLAAGTAFAGALLAIGILLTRALFREFESLLQTGILLLLDLGLAFLLIPVLHFFADWVVLPGSTLKEEIERDQNFGAGLLEAVVLVSFSAIIFFAV